MVTGETKARMRSLCGELLKLVGLTQGHVEVHACHGKPTKLDIIDKSVRFEENGHDRVNR